MQKFRPILSFEFASVDHFFARKQCISLFSEFYDMLLAAIHNFLTFQGVSEIIVFEAPLDLKFNKFKTIQAMSDKLSDFAANLSGKCLSRRNASSNLL